MPSTTSGRTWRRFLLGLGVLAVPSIGIAVESPSPAGINPVISILAGAILGYLIGWWVTADRLL